MILFHAQEYITMGAMRGGEICTAGQRGSEEPAHTPSCGPCDRPVGAQLPLTIEVGACEKLQERDVEGEG
jgi:hypothetical protein